MNNETDKVVTLPSHLTDTVSQIPGVSVFRPERPGKITYKRPGTTPRSPLGPDFDPEGCRRQKVTPKSSQYLKKIQKGHK